MANHIAEEDQPLAGACVTDMRRLLGGDIQPLTEDFPIPAGLIEKIDEVAVSKCSRSPGRQAGP